MGQCHSSHSVHGNMSLRRRFLKKRSSTRNDLSATFHVLDVNMMQNNLLNINIASEEELMTLPGVSRTIAHNVIDYRNVIGCFKKVEDLALVSGIGASKLQEIRGEITTVHRYPYLKKNDSCSCQTSLSEEQSLDSFFSGESTRSKPFFKVINVNSANAFQLMSIQGITQKLAANIVDYRDRKGAFKTLDNLLKVKGINYRTLGAIRLYLTTESPMDVENDSGVLDMKPNSDIEMFDQMTSNFNSTNRDRKGHRRSKSAPMKYASLKEENISQNDLSILLSNRSKRPILVPRFNFHRGKRQAVRIATWNLEKLTDDKASNPGTTEVICRTILENGIGIICFQGLLSVSGLCKIMSELNEPTLPWVKQWPGSNGSWKLAIYPQLDQHKPFSAFMYDTSQAIEITKSIQKVSCLSNTSLAANFQVNSLNVNFVCILDEEPGTDNVTPVNGNCDNAGLIVCAKRFEDRNFEHNCCDLLSDSCDENVEQNETHHIYVEENSKRLCTGQRGVISDGLSHMAIPQGWKWGGTVSKYKPTWIELFVDQSFLVEPVKSAAIGDAS